MRKRIARGLVLLILGNILTGCVYDSNGKMDASQLTVIELETYYNGATKIALDQLVSEFNNTVGEEEGVFVKASSRGDMQALFRQLEMELGKAKKDQNFPDIFSCYMSNALPFEEEGLLVNLKDYFTKRELEAYVDLDIEEGQTADGKELIVFPIAKSLEVMTINKTDWDVFAAECGVSIKRLSTWEDLAEVSKIYYEWSGGKVLFGRDAIANFMLAGMHQLGADIFQINDGAINVNLDKNALKKLWDSYYVPYVSGYYTNIGPFRSDNIKIGDLIVAVGSSAASAYYPKEVTVGDREPYQIDTLVLPVPGFRGTEPAVVQQGAGMTVVKSDEDKERAAVTFLKWFTRAEINSRFSAASGYLPVKKEALQLDYIANTVIENNMRWNDTVYQTINTAIEESNTYDLYTMKLFDGSEECRTILDESLKNQAEKDREEVVRQCGQGKSQEEAVKALDTERKFEAWYQMLKTQLEEAVR